MRRVLVSTFNYLAYRDAMLMTYLVMSCGKRIIFLVTSGYSPYFI
ncbi:hypothetical protein HanPSC8_Chr17g0781451 [Helianthus annuus]|nr:hypothetical protein HanPSC8_Chr17g0781451 [Helianthus annuus]